MFDRMAGWKTLLLEHARDSWKRLRDQLVSLPQPCLIEQDGERRCDQLQELLHIIGKPLTTLILRRLIKPVHNVNVLWPDP
jgi:hypothetical protein